MNNIKKARLLRDLQQKQVALEMDVSQATVSEWESGRSKPTSAKLVKLSALLGFSIDYLLAGDDNNDQTKPSENSTATFRSRLSNLLANENIEDKRAANVNAGELYDIVEGVLPLTFDKACEIADTFGRSLDYLFGLKDHDERPLIIQGAAAHFDARKLTPEGLRMYENVVQMLAEKYLRDDD